MRRESHSKREARNCDGGGRVGGRKGGREAGRVMDFEGVLVAFVGRRKKLRETRESATVGGNGSVRFFLLIKTELFSTN
jgi:hypothetical protein